MGRSLRTHSYQYRYHRTVHLSTLNLCAAPYLLPMAPNVKGHPPS